MYLEKRYRKWWAFHDIPPSLRHLLANRKRFSANLKTEDRREAKRRAALHEQRWLLEIEEARTGGTRALEADAQYWRSELLMAADDQRDTVLWVIGDKMDELALRAPITDPDHPDFEGQEAVKEARKFYGIATGQLVETAEQIEAWLQMKALEEKQTDMYRTDLNRLAERFPYLTDISRRSARQWVDHLATADGLSPKTIDRILAVCRGYWEYLGDLELVEADSGVFDRLVRQAKKAAKSSKRKERKAFEPREVVTLLREAEAAGDIQLKELITMAMWTGCRIGEICALRIENVGDDTLHIEDAKTRAGWRRVPVHPELKQPLFQLVGKSSDGYLLSDLPTNKYGKRSDAIGKRFGRLKRAHGFGETHVFHSIRKTVASQLSSSGVPEVTAAAILGHQSQSVTYGVYDDPNVMIDLRDDTLRKAISCIHYPLLR